MAVENQNTYNVSADASGDWEFEVPADLSAGPHTVVATDENGVEQQTTFFVVKEESPGQSAPALTPVVAGGSSWLFASIAIFAVLSMLGVWQIKRIVRSNAKPKEKVISLAVVSGMLAIIVGAAGLIVWREARQKGVVINKAPETVAVAGALRDPLTGDGVGGVDIVAGTARVRTASDGRYVFEEAPVALGLIITHPELHRALKIVLPTADNRSLDVYFNAPLYNTLIDCVNLEARNQAAEWYRGCLPAFARATITESDFTARFATNLAPADALAQELLIGSAEVLSDYWSDEWQARFDKALKVTIVAGEPASYLLIPENNNWKILKLTEK